MRTAIVVALLFGVTVAGSEGLAAADNYGAIAAAPDGSFGYSFDQATRIQAEKRALRECRSSRCEVKVWFRNNCGAYARGQRGSEGWAYAGTRVQAEKIALGQCASRARGCRIVCWACTAR